MGVEAGAPSGFGALEDMFLTAKTRTPGPISEPLTAYIEGLFKMRRVPLLPSFKKCGHAFSNSLRVANGIS